MPFVLTGQWILGMTIPLRSLILHSSVAPAASGVSVSFTGPEASAGYGKKYSGKNRGILSNQTDCNPQQIKLVYASLLFGRGVCCCQDVESMKTALASAHIGKRVCMLCHETPPPSVHARGIRRVPCDRSSNVNRTSHCSGVRAARLG